MATKTVHYRARRPERLMILGIGGAAAVTGAVALRWLRSGTRSASTVAVRLFELSVEIRRPPEEVFAFVADLRNDLQWGQRVIKEVQQISEGPLSIGSRFLQVGNFLGLRFEIPITITEYEPNRKFGFEAANGPLRATGRRSVEAIAGGTRLIITTERRSGGLLTLVWPIFVYWARREVKMGLANLKNLLEAQA